MLIFVETSDDHQILEIEIDETSDIEFVIGMVSSLKNWPPHLISITVDEKELSHNTVVSSLDLGTILTFHANLLSNNEEYLNEMFDVKQQQAIEDQIRKKNVQHNLEYAYENNPESFISYNLLFIDCKINNVEVKAMLDTGAQISIIPIELARTCHVDYLIDERFNSTAVGVGVQKIIGKIHALTVVTGDIAFTNSFSILAGPLNNIILGVDWLTKNRALIDLQKRCLTLNGIDIPFVSAN